MKDEKRCDFVEVFADEPGEGDTWYHAEESDGEDFEELAVEIPFRAEVGSEEGGEVLGGELVLSEGGKDRAREVSFEPAKGEFSKGWRKKLT